MLVPGLLQLAPGFLGTKDVLKMLTAGAHTPMAGYFDVIVLGTQLGIGFLVASLLFRPRGPSRRPKAAAATP
jgi:hypothetical protein